MGLSIHEELTQLPLNTRFNTTRCKRVLGITVIVQLNTYSFSLVLPHMLRAARKYLARSLRVYAPKNARKPRRDSLPHRAVSCNSAPNYRSRAHKTIVPTRFART